MSQNSWIQHFYSHLRHMADLFIIYTIWLLDRGTRHCSTYHFAIGRTSHCVIGRLNIANYGDAGADKFENMSYAYVPDYHKEGCIYSPVSSLSS